MKAMVLLATFLGFSVLVPQQQKKQEDFGLPELNKINNVTLGPSWGCQKAPQPDYGDAALFLSALSRQRNNPELVFEGSCGGEDAFISMTAGDDIGVVADLGEIPLEKVTARLAFNTRDVGSFDLYSKFVRRAKVQVNHTYAVLIARAETKSLFVLTVIEHIPNKKLELQYAVKQYQVLGLRAKSPGFGWNIESDTSANRDPLPAIRHPEPQPRSSSATK